MCASYGFDVTRPAQNAREAVQFVYLAYLAAVKRPKMARRCLSERTSTFLDIYIEKDIREGTGSVCKIRKITYCFLFSPVSINAAAPDASINNKLQ